MSTAVKLATPEAGTRRPASPPAQPGIEPVAAPTMIMIASTIQSAAVRKSPSIAASIRDSPPPEGWYKALASMRT